MNPEFKKILMFQVSDKCNYNCKDCHWFSGKINYCDPQPINDYLLFLSKFSWIDRIVFSGGEPTLWSDLPELINKIGSNVGQVAIYTNGSNPNIFESILFKNVYIRLSVHKQSSYTNLSKIVRICNKRQWQVKLYGFDGNLPSNIEVFKSLGQFKINQNQLAEYTIKNKDVTKNYIYCEPRVINIGTDGNAYFCEKGLRTKEDKYKMGFSLTNGIVSFSNKKCIPELDCYSCFDTEQYLHLTEDEFSSAWSK